MADLDLLKNRVVLESDRVYSVIILRIKNLFFYYKTKVNIKYNNEYNIFYIYIF